MLKCADLSYLYIKKAAAFADATTILKKYVDNC